MTKAANIKAIEKATKMPWGDWVRFLDNAAAKDLSHKEIAARAYGKLKDIQDNAGWWSQGIAVAYEQHIGRRQPGQRSDGTYEAAVTKTLTGTMDGLMKAWLRLVKGKGEFSGVAITKKPTSSQTDKRRHWGCGLEDGSRITVDISLKSPNKVLFAITHAKLPNNKAAQRWRSFWKVFLESVKLTT